MDFDIANALFNVMIFWILTTPHEFAHAWVADRLGDDTPRLDGRVTLNPLAHVDMWGTIIVPLLASLLGGVFFGWGRAVRINPSKLRGGNNGHVLVALAGPASNVVFAVVLGAIAAFVPAAAEPLIRAAYISLFLALFNLLPVPPLDGSSLLLGRVPDRWLWELGRYGFLIVMVLMSATDLGRWMSAMAYTGVAMILGVFR
jgi:Zn-dependent protease